METDSDIDDVDDEESAEYDFSDAFYDPEEASRQAAEIAAQVAAQGTTGW